MEKKEYEKPEVESEEIFEQTALACGSMFPTGDAKDSGSGCDNVVS